jgi:two-component system chemotaxis response regulator CheY
MKVLIIDDSRAMRTIIGQILKGIGSIEIAEAGNGLEGIQKLESGPIPELTMVDWNMPEMDGLEFVQAVRGRPEFDAMRIMMVTTETEMGRMADALAQGVNEYVMKPFSKDVIIQKFQKLHLAV